MSKITDPAVLAAMDFIDVHYAKLGHMAPTEGSREEQHAISVLAAFIRAAPEGPRLPPPPVSSQDGEGGC